MNLAYHDVRHRVGRFVGTSLGIALLFTVVLAMAGIYLGLVDDATILLRSMRADVWVVQQGTRGPFADASRLDPSIVSRVSALPGVTRARASRGVRCAWRSSASIGPSIAATGSPSSAGER